MHISYIYLIHGKYSATLGFMRFFLQNNYRKKISNALKLLGFKITIYTNLRTVNFLDVTLNFANCT